MGAHRRPSPVPASLQAEWDRRLERSGFRDLERGLDPHMKIRDDPQPDPATEEFYRAGRALLHNRRIRMTRIQRDIWTRHCDGQLHSEIAAALKVSRNRIVKQTIDELTECVKNGYACYATSAVPISRAAKWSKNAQAAPTRAPSQWLDLILSAARSTARRARRGRIPERCYLVDSE
jgi:hypothetical protein